MTVADTDASGWLAAAALPARWQGSEAHGVLDTALHDGQRFLATWAAWRRDPQRSARLDYLVLEHPTAAAAPTATEPGEDAADPLRASLRAELQRAWPPATPDLHRLVFDAGRVQLLLARGGPARWWRTLVAQVDTCFVDHSVAQTGPGLVALGRVLARLVAPGARLVAEPGLAGLEAALRPAGFAAWSSARTAVASPGGWFVAEHASRVAHPRPAARRPAPLAQAGREAIVIGAGLAGCATTAALARQGWQVRLVDRHAQAAEGASGNAAGLFHGVVHAQDGAHARFIRACALETTRLLRQVSSCEQPRAGQSADPAPWHALQGLMRLETGLSLAAMRTVLDALRLPPDFVQALDPDTASTLAGLPLRATAWFYPGGGWLRPAALARHWLSMAGERCRFMGEREVSAVQREAGQWQVLDADGGVIAAASVLVLANADEAGRLLGSACWPAEAVRGQVSLLDEPQRHGLQLPRVPLSGSGYVLPAVDGRAVFGATSQAGDMDPSVRAKDHLLNLHRLGSMSDALLIDPVARSAQALQGRTAWRCVSQDRLPLIGGIPAAWLQAPMHAVEPGSAPGHADQPRHVPRVPGLYLCSALGSRGITLAGLAGELLAAMVAGTPWPLGADLADAVDPARFLTRARRRASAGRKTVSQHQDGAGAGGAAEAGGS